MVLGVIIEPIQIEGGNCEASSYFFNKLQKIVSKNNAFLIMDEIETGGGASGKMWLSEFLLEFPPDLVVFSKRMQIGGFYCKREIAYVIL